ncbi:uncharacterized protein LOC105423838 [Pogonomyrmex barbatus]|uniref:Uncharacterized protein LOC105423838 n=1 Tax=Pogonomyrmex barbatus TaxID=144034 RepID=A0A6I9VY48_9HYME|nr:uncharacterized protein LOC105423838 [Pogonomyrmex barbatus]
MAFCMACAQEWKKPPNVPLTPWPWPDKFWARIHSDFLGSFFGHMFMIIDAYAKWPEVIDMRKCTQTSEVEIASGKIWKCHVDQIIRFDDASNTRKNECDCEEKNIRSPEKDVVLFRDNDSGKLAKLYDNLYDILQDQEEYQYFPRENNQP